MHSAAVTLLAGHAGFTLPAGHAALPSVRRAGGGAAMNIFGDLLGDDKLKEQKPYERPLLPSLVKKEASSYVLAEKLFSWSGEDFKVRDTSGEEVVQIQGSNVNIGGLVVDKLYFKDHEGAEFCSVERRIIAATTCYDIYRDGECIAKVDRELFSATPQYKFFYEGDANPFPDFTASGTFSDRKYTFKTGFGETIARVSRGEEAFKDVDTYQVEVAAGVDAAAIIAVAVVIDEDHDEADASEKQEEAKKEGGGWPFG